MRVITNVFVLFVFTAILFQSDLTFAKKAESNHQKHSFRTLVSNSIKVYLKTHVEVELEYKDNGIIPYQLNLQSLTNGFKHHSSNPANPAHFGKPLLLFIQVFII